MALVPCRIPFAFLVVVVAVKKHLFPGTHTRTGRQNLGEGVEAQYTPIDVHGEVAGGSRTLARARALALLELEVKVRIILHDDEIVLSRKCVDASLPLHGGTGPGGVARDRHRVQHLWARCQAVGAGSSENPLQLVGVDTVLIGGNVCSPWS